jgi:DNA-binding transcriptional MerR regulator
MRRKPKLGKLLTTNQIAEILGRTPRYIRQLSASGLIPYIQFPGRDRIYQEESVALALSRIESKASVKKNAHLRAA